MLLIELLLMLPQPLGVPSAETPRSMPVAHRSVASHGQSRRGHHARATQTTDREMTALFDADQAARADPKTIDWKVVGADDAARRKRTQALLDAGRLHSGDDFYHAAFIFQHGEAPEDFLKAHALAVIAAARGKSEATWIAAATLDRYLQRIGQPQVYGTQFQHPPGQAWTQEPYRRDLLSDALREATGVPPLAAQKDQLKDWQRRLP